MAVAWNHLQVELIDRLGDEGLALARELAMTTYRSEADFDERFGRAVEPDGRPSIVSYLDHQGAKLVDRFDGDTYRVLAGAMDRHDIGAGRGGIDAALATSRGRARRADRGRDRRRHPVRAAPGPRARRGRDARPGFAARYREIRSTKGHDAFLVEWDQLAALLREALVREPVARAPGPAPAAVSEWQGLEA